MAVDGTQWYTLLLNYKNELHSKQFAFQKIVKRGPFNDILDSGA